MADSVDQSLRARREAIVRQHMYCETHHDIDGALATFDYATYDVVGQEHLKPPGAAYTHPDPDAVRRLLTDLTTGLPDLELHIEKLHHADDAVIIEGRTRGTHLGPLHGIPPTGRRVDVRGVIIFRFEGDRMTNETIYGDSAAMRRQLGFTSMDL